jgi:hypothetical protein
LSAVPRREKEYARVRICELVETAAEEERRAARAVVARPGFGPGRLADCDGEVEEEDMKAVVGVIRGRTKC